MTDSFSDRLRAPMGEASHELRAAQPGGMVVLVTGLASAGKARLVAALERRLRPARISVRGLASNAPPEPGEAVLHVHAESDLEAMVEGALQAAERRSARAAHLVVPVDWEPVDRSVNRAIESLRARGVVTDVRGA
ncbi:MAG: hypothetical protein ACT4QD_00380 [Acidobacteriota bacterium]